MDIDQEIATLKVQFNTLERLQLYLKTLEEKRHALVKSQASLELKVEKEYQDYQRVKNQNEQALRNLFMLPDEERLEKEKQEYFEVVLAVRKIEQELSLIDFEIKILKDKAAKIEALRSKLLDLQQVKTQQLIRDNADIQALQQQHDRQGAIIEGIESINEQGGDCLVRIKEIEVSLWQIHVTKHSSKSLKVTDKRILGSLNNIHGNLAKLQIGFTKMEALLVAYSERVSVGNPQLPDWKQKLASLKEFTDNFFIQMVKKNDLDRDFIHSKDQFTKLKYQLEEIIKENRYLIEEHKQTRDRTARDLADQLKI